jgi:hypothetical protein
MVHYKLLFPHSLEKSNALISDVAITRDIDFYGKRSTIKNIQTRIVGSDAFYMPGTAITALVGTVKIYADDDKFMNIDVIDQIAGLNTKQAASRAIELENPSGIPIKVLHPIDVLSSRVYNFYKFSEKQTGNGRLQINLSLQIARCYIITIANETKFGEKGARKLIERIVRLAQTASGRYAKGNGADFLHAIPEDVITSTEFHSKRWPQIIQILHDARPQSYIET